MRIQDIQLNLSMGPREGGFLLFECVATLRNRLNVDHFKGQHLAPKQNEKSMNRKLSAV